MVIEDSYGVLGLLHRRPGQHELDAADSRARASASAARTPSATSISLEPRVREIAEAHHRLAVEQRHLASARPPRRAPRPAPRAAPSGRRRARSGSRAGPAHRSRCPRCARPARVPAHSVRPPGRSSWMRASCCDTSPAVMPSDCSARGSRSTRTSRSTPPVRATEPTPRMPIHRLGHHVVDEPRQLVGAHAVGAHRVGQQRAADHVDLGDHRLLDVERQVDADAGDGVAHLVERLVEVGLEAELDRGDRDALAHGRDRACLRPSRWRPRPRPCA